MLGYYPFDSDIIRLVSDINSPNSITVQVLLLRFGFSDRIQIRARVLDNMPSPNKSYEYEVSLIDILIIHIYIYILISFEIKYILYKNIKYVNFKTFPEKLLKS